MCKTCTGLTARGGCPRAYCGAAAASDQPRCRNSARAAGAPRSMNGSHPSGLSEPRRMSEGQAEIVNARADQASRQRHLRQPPQPPQPASLTPRQPQRSQIRQHRQHLHGRIEGSRASHRTEQRIELVIGTHRPPRSPSIENGRTMLRNHEHHPGTRSCGRLRETDHRLCGTRGKRQSAESCPPRTGGKLPYLRKRSGGLLRLLCLDNSRGEPHACHQRQQPAGDPSPAYSHGGRLSGAMGEEPMSRSYCPS